MLDVSDFESLWRCAVSGARAGGAANDAEDIAQEALVSLALSRDWVAVAPSYVHRRAYWFAVDSWRADVARARREAEWASARPAASTQDDQVLEIGLLTCPELRRMASLLAEGRSFAEIGRFMDLPKATVQRRVEKLRRTLAA